MSSTGADELNISEESPYRGLLVESSTYNVNTTLDDEKDFKTPKRRTVKPSQTKIVKNAKKKSKKKTVNLSASQMRFTKIVQDDSESFGVNPEHWQLALTLSKSVQEQSVEDKSVSSASSSEEKNADLQSNLRRFGFTTGGKRLQVQNRRPVVNKKKKSRYRFVTPILFIRTQEDRDKLISEKVAQVLSESVDRDCMYYSDNHRKPFSKELQKYWNDNIEIFRLHGVECKFLNDAVLYTKSLNLEPNKIKCGSLLKDWAQIPGRDVSPLREVDTAPKEEPIEVENETQALPNVVDEQCPYIKYDNGGTPESLLLNIEEEQYIYISEEKDSTSVVLRHTPSLTHSIKSCSSPDLFSSDDEIANEAFLNVVSSVRQLTAEINSPKEDPNYLSQSLLSLTPQEKSISFSPNKNNSKSSSFLDKSNIENDNGICSYENFRTDEIPIENCVDLTVSSEDDVSKGELFEPKKPKESESSLGDFILDRSKLDEFDTSLDESDENSSLPRFLTCKTSPDFCGRLTGVDSSTLVQKSNFSTFAEKSNSPTSVEKSNSSTSVGKSNSLRVSHRLLSFSDQKSPKSHTLRRSKSLNVTDYINDMLNQDENATDGSKLFSRHNSFLSEASLSQSSIILSDEELNYSSKFSSTLQNVHVLVNSDSMDVEVANNEPEGATLNSSLVQDELPCQDVILLNTDSNESMCKDKTVLSDVEFLDKIQTTPKTEVIIRTSNVTPSVDYDGFNTPKINEELTKFGLKPMKRQRGVQLLKHIYEATHPFVDVTQLEKQSTSDDDSRIVKKRKCDKKTKSPSPKKSRSPKKNDFVKRIEFNDLKDATPEIVGSIISEVDELVFERKSTKKVLSCLLPLQIAWHNLVSSNSNLKKNILLYEPIHLEVVYDMLKDQGFCYHLEDLLAFLDKKCITVRTNQNQNRRRNVRKKYSSPQK